MFLVDKPRDDSINGLLNANTICIGELMKIRLAVGLGLLLMANVAIGQETTLKSVDANSDGKVSVQEFSDYAETRLSDFDQLDAFAKKVDADGDGVITQKEFGARRDVLQTMMQAQEGEEKAEAADTSPHKVGDKATDFELQSIGKKIKLSDNFGEKGNPVVVVFSRANW